MEIQEPTSIAPANEATSGSRGQMVHRSLASHTARLEPRLYKVANGVWCQVGNGLSNQTFVEGPGGLIAIDTGESVEEMAAALVAVRTHTSADVVAVIYTHYHYVDGTTALLGGRDKDSLAVWGHPGIAANRLTISGDISPVAQRGLVHQFGILLPEDGPDSVENVGLGLWYRNPAHAPFTAGHLPVTHPVDGPMDVEIAGLSVQLYPTPSDADDNITIAFPSLGVCVNNIVWPVLFNVFPIRGEQYRDPQRLLAGLDHIAALGAEHLVGAHGPPLSGRDAIASTVEAYRDSVQFLWDQSVRGINKGLTSPELGRFVHLPEHFGGSYFTQQHYGLAEHHARQVHAGLRGWFDGDEANLFPVEPEDRATKLVAAMGGGDEVAARIDEALEADDLRWALELATLAYKRADSTDSDAGRLAGVLRDVASRTTSANVRNWCLTRAREVDGSLDLSRFRVHRFSTTELASADPDRIRASVAALRVTLDPARAAGVRAHLRITIGDVVAGLHVRNSVAIPTDGSGAETAVSMSQATWAALLGNKAELSTALEEQAVAVIGGETSVVVTLLGCFEAGGLRR